MHTKLKDTIHLRREDISNNYVQVWWLKNIFTNFFLAAFFGESQLEKTRINLTGVDISKVDMDYSSFELYFSRQANENEISAVYETLLDKYKINEGSENYRAIEIEYHNHKGDLFNFINRIWWNYEYSNGRIFFWSVAFLLLFSY